jgi:hypothetical protein
VVVVGDTMLDQPLRSARVLLDRPEAAVPSVKWNSLQTAMAFLERPVYTGSRRFEVRAWR